MKKIKWRLSIGFPTATREGEVELTDEEAATLNEEQLEQLAWEDALQHVDVELKVVDAV